MADETTDVASFARFDERIKAMNSEMSHLQQHVEDIWKRCDSCPLKVQHMDTVQKIAVLEANCEEVTELGKTITDLDKRLVALELSSGKSRDRWNQILSFVTQLAWVILAAWLLTKLNLQPPAVP